MIDLEEIKTLVMESKPIEEILENFDWKEFEEIVAEIFRNNGFKVKQNFRFKTKRRYEIDVVAVKEDCVFLVDCKQWSKGRYKTTGLRYAVEEQESRLKEFKKFLKGNPIAQNMIVSYETSGIFPLVVTLLQENLTKENSTFIIPIWKLNSFLLELENYL